ncbi:glycosyltransferase family 2 protein [Pseudohoeflea suaedae]|uniref:Glycosyltransferase family 2 protein n=2 Tax=Pseudohoeflea suaedae TaxID=877384 RepID=A0A4R5PQM3_9HYPH|nr:glycosyltransferase family 2 protein [Pseudohoeflea suaedae]
MATYNGAQYIEEQLKSLETQTWPSVDVVISDDGSTDRTLEILEAFSRRWKKGRVTIARGPQAGFAENFRSLINGADVRGPYVCFSDQDDIWREEKLTEAVNWLAAQPIPMPALFCGRTQLFPDPGRHSMSPPFSRPPVFRNALVQSIAGANTMVMNRAAFELLRTASARTSFASHDWWTYLLVTGAGGRVFFSQVPYVLYRQHEGNLVGANTTLSSRITRLRMLFNGRFRRWTDLNLAALDLCIDLLSDDNRKCLSTFRQARDRSLHLRMLNLWRSGVYRQTVFGQASLYAACMMRLL